MTFDKTIFSVHEFVPNAYCLNIAGNEIVDTSTETCKELLLNDVNRIIGKSLAPLDHTMVKLEYRENSEGERERVYIILSEEHAREFYHNRSTGECQFTFSDEVPNTAQYNMDDSLWNKVQDYLQKLRKGNLMSLSNQDAIVKYIAANVRHINAFDKEEPSLFFALLVMYMDLGISEDRVRSLLVHECAYVKAAGVVIARYVFSPSQTDDILVTTQLLGRSMNEIVESSHIVNVVQGESLTIPALIGNLIEHDEFLEAWFPIYSSVHHVILCENVRRVSHSRPKIYEDDSISTLPFDFSNARSFFQYINLRIDRGPKESKTSNPIYHSSRSHKDSPLPKEDPACSSISLPDHEVCTVIKCADFEDIPYI
ncbi:hypothetical protein XU18_0360 [Perkinsela sp. CCAP 1560/4]|nr:hypothetical protein XU18_0360 [Perkinsela sp. CCAP 1560/4]|eukprot:KNH09675.1 hypothetical protein XU18_0360 [Perkinsela sp. CCAP 1560/4]